MKRALPLLLLGSALSANAMAAGPSIIGSVYLPDTDVDNDSASPDSLLLEIRQPLNRNFWLGASLGTALGEDSILPGIDVELGNSLAVNLGVQAEFSHRVYGYAYVGYGKAELDATGGGVDGNGVAWGLGVDFKLNDNLLVDVGYATLFDGDMEDDIGTEYDVTIAGPRVGLGFTF